MEKPPSVPTNAELKKIIDDLRDEVDHLKFVLGGVQAEQESLRRQVHHSRVNY